MLHESALAHGLERLNTVNDINVGYDGHWRRLVARLQPELVNAGFRGGSQERLLLRNGIIAQSHHGPKGAKQVVRTRLGNDRPTTRVWFNGEESCDEIELKAAALVADAYGLFLLGPMFFFHYGTRMRDMKASLAQPAHIDQGGAPYDCNVINLELAPGLGDSSADRLALYLDKQTKWMRRVRMTLNGLPSTQGALVDIDTTDHRLLEQIVWPTAFHERLLRPAPLDVHTWKLTGLDVNRGEIPADIQGHTFLGNAVAPAKTLS